MHLYIIIEEVAGLSSRVLEDVDVILLPHLVDRLGVFAPQEAYHALRLYFILC